MKEFSVVSRSCVPDVPPRKTAGVYARAYAAMLDLKPAEALEVKIAGGKSEGAQYKRMLQRIATAEGVATLHWNRNDDFTTYWFWLERSRGTA